MNKEDIYYQKWSELLEVSFDEIKNLFEYKENVKKQGRKGYKVEIDYGYILSAFLHRSGLIDFYKVVRNNKIIHTISNNLFNNLKQIKKERLEFERFDEKTKEKVKEFFKEDTLKLAQEFNLDIEKLRKYNYL